MKELICIVCPRGCHLQVDEKNGYTVTGNSCARGAEYGKTELTDPRRVVTSTVKITGALYRRCPVRTDKAVKKDQMAAVVKALDEVNLVSPVRRGQVVIKNVLCTGADVIVTKDL